MKKITLFCLSLFLGTIGFSQEKTKNKLMPAADKDPVPADVYKSAPTGNFKSMTVPSGLVVPGEWEESEAVAIQWPYSNSPFADDAVLYSKLADAIQQAAKVWIIIDNGYDSTTVKSYMSYNGVTLYNHHFIIGASNSFWTRDSGPIDFYYGSNDTRGSVDTEYYLSRTLDDQVPSYIADYMGINNYFSQLRFEGGNFMVDGFGHGFYSTRLLDNNNNASHSPPWNFSDCRDTINKIFNLSSVTELSKLVCDGGTGHIDMYVKLLDEQNIVISKYPNVVSAVDAQTIEDDYNTLLTVKNVYGRPYRISRMPMPKKDDGSYSITCSDINADARGYVNGVFVNKTYIFPIFSNQSSGDVAGDSIATQMYRKMLPGYHVVPIDARYLSPSGGALHCITMQIPADNPVRFWHPTVEGVQPYQAAYHMVSKITNRSGIATALCKWRKKGGSWNSVSLSDSSGYFIGNIANAGFTIQDTIEYYLDATANNSKKMTKPITAPLGYYRFYFNNMSLGGTDLSAKFTEPHLFGAFPNPAKENTTIRFYSMASSDVSVHVRNTLGQLSIATPVRSVNEGVHEAGLMTSDLAPGVYFYSLVINGNAIATRKLVIE